ncbi:unnamed protein product [Porites lobata]|uniref:Endonuclease/exonuclease/phosphatase domain-containing protein n=1 Tax=Porites lobata TaxID=104759 RepID=A0ABN8RP82_9CNID|nr:unnamed protein product [Porites lobata]
MSPEPLLMTGDFNIHIIVHSDIKRTRLLGTNSVRNYKTYNSVELNFDHRILTVTFKEEIEGSERVEKRDKSDPISHQELLDEWKKYRSTLLNNTTAIDTARPPPDESVLPINTA